MKKNVELTEDEKMFFISKYLKVQEKFHKAKKTRKGFLITYLLLSAIGAAAMPFNFVLGYCILFPCSLIGLPTLYAMSCKIFDIVDEATTYNISYKQFKKMFKSGELDKLIAEYKKTLQESHCHKLKNNSFIEQKTNSPKCVKDFKKTTNPLILKNEEQTK